MAFEAITFNTEEELRNYIKTQNLMTQDEVNKLVGAEKAKAKTKAETEAAEKYKDFESFKTKAEKYDSDLGLKDTKIKELEDKVKKYESDSVKTKIARAAGLPDEMADRLRGTTEEEMKADAESLAKLVAKKDVAPLGDPEPNRGDGDDGKDKMTAGLKKMLKEMKGQE